MVRFLPHLVVSQTVVAEKTPRQKNSQHGFNTLLLSRFTRSWPGCMAAKSLHTVPRSWDDEGDFKAPRLNWTKSPCKLYVWFWILRQKCFDNSPISTVQQPVGIEIRRPSFEDLGIFAWLAMRRWHNECWLHPNWWHGIASAHVARTVCKLLWGQNPGGVCWCVCFYYRCTKTLVKLQKHIVDGRSPASVEVGSLSHHLQGFLHPRWWAGFLNHQQYVGSSGES